MATNPNEVTGGEPDETELEPGAEEQQNPDTDGQQQDEGEGEGGEPQAQPTIEDVASEIGWVPKEEYKGPPEQWKPAADFIRASREIQNRYANDIRGLKTQIDVMARTTADIVQDRLAQQREELTTRYNELVEEGNAAEAYKVAQRIEGLNQRAAQPVPQAPSPEGQEFAARNAHWLGKDQAATARAVEITDTLAAKGVPAADQLRAAERILRLEYPEYFQNQANGQQRKAAPNVNRPGSRSPGNSNRQKGFSDMPPDAQKVAKDMAERGVIKSADDYVKRYWQNAEGKR